MGRFLARALVRLSVCAVLAIASCTLAAPAAQAAPVPAGYQGWGYVAPLNGGASAWAWQWSSTTGSWVGTSRPQFQQVWLYPFATGWEWTWTSATGWLAMRATDVAIADAAAPSGEPLPTAPIAGWRQVFSDDFTTNVPLGSFPAAVSSRWSAYPYPWKDTSKNGTYWPERTVSVNGGVLNVRVHTENGLHLVAALVPKLPTMTYGRYAIRFRADQVHGYKTAWLLWPDSGVWPRDGEVDFPEGNLDGRISAFMHRQGATSGGDQDAFTTTATYASWHTAVIEKTPTYIRFLLDGRVIGTSTSRLPNTPMHWVIQTETNLDGYAPADSAAGTVQIDWVAVWVPA